MALSPLSHREPSDRRPRTEHRGVLVADTRDAVRTLETTPPSWYLPPADVTPGLLRRSDQRSFCEWKGQVIYWHLAVDGELLRNMAWSYPEPTPAFEALRDHLAFYAGPLDRCTIDGEQVLPQPGGFYVGLITADLTGPFKGVPGSMK